MLYACLGCGREREIPTSSAWPKGCPECGGTVWTSAPATPMKRFEPVSYGTIDASSAANGLLRQPGAPRLHPI